MTKPWEIREERGPTKPMPNDPRQWERDLADAGWRKVYSHIWRAPCGCMFRGPFRAWAEMNGTHLADHIASGLPLASTVSEKP